MILRTRCRSPHYLPRMNAANSARPPFVVRGGSIEGNGAPDKDRSAAFFEIQAAPGRINLAAYPLRAAQSAAISVCGTFTARRENGTHAAPGRRVGHRISHCWYNVTRRW